MVHDPRSTGPVCASTRSNSNEEYIAGWLSFFPAAHLTPYVGIHSVPPSSFVRLASGNAEGDASTGISTPPREFVTAPMANTKSISEPSSRNRFDDAFVLTLLSLPN